jgi:hypothetical protein
MASAHAHKEPARGVASAAAPKARPAAAHATSARALDVPATGYEAQRAAVRPSAKPAAHAVTEAKPEGDTHEGLRPALKAAGGMVPFMKAMAADEKVAGIGPTQFDTLWDHQENEDWLKDQFRAVSPNMHEWIPSNQIHEIVSKARATPDGPRWIDLHNELRSPTPHVIFAPETSSHETPDGSVVLHGHSGAIYVDGVPQTKHQGDFHDELREKFLAAPDVATAVDGLKNTAEKWLWTGAPPPKPLSSAQKDSMGRPIDPQALMAARATQYAEMTQLFDAMKVKHGGAKERKRK